MKNKTRQSNFELMRIISMLMIVIYHILIHGQVIKHTDGSLNILLIFLQAILYVHVNSFVLLTGYFQSKSKFKLSKLISLNNTVWFYEILILIIAITLNTTTVTPLTKLRTIIPLSYGTYWFITQYLALYVISPILNVVVNNTTKEKFRNIIILYAILVSFIGTISVNGVFNNNNGYSLHNFILLYFIGAYLQKYDIDKSYFLKVFSKPAKNLIYAIIFFGCAIINTLSYLVGYSIIGYGTTMSEIGNIMISAFTSYGNPLLIIQSICYFLWFRNLNIKSKVINIISSCTIGIYLIHDNPMINMYVFDKLGLYDVGLFSKSIIPKVFVLGIIIFIVCFIIEFIRKMIFTFIYNRKISCKFRKWYRNYIDSLGIKINW